ncbi:unnamed protein product [Didymodactylos carnosus]|uniref:Uncharacterized protein n=1 Tax=Didymodactylos carnosus TaxID=1234261 RepID=A0A815RVW4_9BILA|nr:unnamed protein product [Didymodactylos carnosus]CAF1522958.1 unnamed protein product [Didymodactylos carnosus]CAF4309771.1 unnamed protein product [Didymodactylos carnosus]CAF4347789.1 unnamed protein product [Didymodactylos carnosus]
MVHSTGSTSETVHVVKELIKIFSDNYQETKLKVLILDKTSAQSLFFELRDVIEKYKKVGDIDQQSNFRDQLKRFKNLIEENMQKPTLNHEIVLIIENYLSAIQEDYKLLGNYVQTLEEIEQQSLNETSKNKINDLIIRGVEEKIPNLIYFGQKNSNDNNKKFEIVKKFYGYFIKYISYVREAVENILSDNNYRLKLKSLQSKLLNTEPFDLKIIFQE